MNKHDSEIIPMRLAAAVAIVAIVHISVIVFVFLKTVRSRKEGINES